MVIVNRPLHGTLAIVLSFCHNGRDLASATRVCKLWRSTDGVDRWTVVVVLLEAIAIELDDLKLLKYDPTRIDPSATLPPHRGHLPLLVEPTALRYVCLGFIRTGHYTCASGHPMIPEPPADHLLSPDTPISFSSMPGLVVEEYDCSPPPGDIPIELFKSSESLGLVDKVGRFLYISEPNDHTTGGVLLVPFLSHLKLHPTPSPGVSFHLRS